MVMNTSIYVLARRRGEAIEPCDMFLFNSRDKAIQYARQILESENVQEDFDEQMAIGDILSDWTTYTDGYEDFTVIEMDLTIPNSHKIVFQTH
jgi:hypothetical protein